MQQQPLKEATQIMQKQYRIRLIRTSVSAKKYLCISACYLPNFTAAIYQKLDRMTEQNSMLNMNRANLKAGEFWL